MNAAAVFLILSGGVILTVGDIIMKSWVEHNTLSAYVIGLGVYLIGLMFLVQSFKHENIAEASLAIVLGNVITLIVFSWFYYNEKLALLDFIGIALGIVALVILEARAH